MTVKEIMPMVGRLSVMKFFPSDEYAMVAVAEQFAAFAQDAEQVRYTIRRALALYPQWPGIHELRAVHCGKWPAKDGINAYSAVYLDGIPSESESRNLQIAAPAPALQLAGDVAYTKFPHDACDLLQQAIERRKAVDCAPVVTTLDIDTIKREQNENQQRRMRSDAA
jgi:hypothetical protein